MATTDDKRQKFIALLHELFQLDQPDLDFGFYRIMHAKAGQVTKFLEEDLLGIIQEAFGEADDARIAEAREALEAARKQAAEYGAADPDATEPVKKAKAAYDAAKDSGSNEGDVYDHLYRFFERYYDNGDFMSRRYFARETDGKAAPYAVPYDGREVYLHWANRDQYYIKTSEYLSNFTFDPTQAKEFKAHHGELFERGPLKVHCRIVAATEGEHNNVKASEQTERYFIIHEPEPVKIETGETGKPELVIQFQYRADPEKTGQDGTWRKKRLAEAAETIKARLVELDGAEDYVAALTVSAATEKDKERTLLEKYLVQYTARNTMDYFIHKDLGGFLRRELDFYIKNEVMRLDDIESAEAPRVETYLAKVKVLRRIGRHLIDFLAQLEDFQKKLWLKKKFVVDTQYCITLDRIPEEFYSEIAANKTQMEEWVRLFSISDVDEYACPPTPKFLKANSKLVLDTSHFSECFKNRLVSSLENLDERCDGLLINSENFQALNTLKNRFWGQIDCVYIDPPYNTGSDGFQYKDSFTHSSWIAMMSDRLKLGWELSSVNSSLFLSIDDNEQPRLRLLSENVWGPENFVATVIWQKIFSPKNSARHFSEDHDFILVFAKDGIRWTPNLLPRTAEMESRYSNPDNDSRGPWTSGDLSARNPYSEGRYAIKCPSGRIIAGPPPGTYWRISRAKFDSLNEDGRIWWGEKGDNVPRLKRFLSEVKQGRVPQTIWNFGEVGHTQDAKKELQACIVVDESESVFQTPKPTALIQRILSLSTSNEADKPQWVLDYFAGSAATAHAVIQQNREDDGARRYLLVEIADYFDRLILPRLKKAIYSNAWIAGKPTNRDTGVSQCFKYTRLESYEDTLSNLLLDRSSQRTTSMAADPAFKQDYMLHYWLDSESKGSPSLLNIERFTDPTAYKLKVKKPGTDEYVEKAVDLVETFNWLTGLHVEHLDRWRGYEASFKREVDPELPEDTSTRLMLDGALKETDDGTWHLRKIEGYTLRTPGDQTDREKVLVIWRKLTDDLEQDNLILDEWFKKYRLSARDTEFDVIYVNGSNNLPNLRQAEENWKVRLIEEAFHQAMWDIED